METTTEARPISFHYHPFDYDNRGHAVEKADSKGVKRRYLTGIASGPKLDGDKERMTDRCIQSFMKQANSGNILLYPDMHGFKASEDIGILEKAEVRADGDWYVEFRLYDEGDKVGPHTLETIDKLWRQIRGEEPYKFPMQKGFSIEGDIPKGAILSSEKDDKGNLRKRVLDQVLLNGVVLVPRPAYKDSIASAVYKALGEMSPEKEQHMTENIRETFGEVLKGMETDADYWKAKWKLDEALVETVQKIMRKDGDDTKKAQLDLAYKEYGDMMSDLVLKSKDLFEEQRDAEPEEAENPYAGKKAAEAPRCGAVEKALLDYVKKSSPRPAASAHPFPGPGIADALKSAIKNQTPGGNR